MSETPKLMRKAEFAAHIGRSPAYVTALRKKGRLVLREDGVVLVPESLKLMADTAGGRVDMAEKWAQLAGKAIPHAEPGSDGVPDAPSASPLQAAKARKELAQAEQEEMKAAQMRGDLIPREVVDAVLAFVGGAIRAEWDLLPDQVAPLVAPIASMDECHAILQDHGRNALERFGQVVERQRAELAKGERK